MKVQTSTLRIAQTDSYGGDNRRVEYQGTWAVTDDYQAEFGVQQEKSWSDATPYGQHYTG